MKLLAPSYYPLFSCTKGACRHSCCIGWEIGIDDESYQKYTLLDAGTGKIISQIHSGPDGYAFTTGNDGRCPFLNKENLCDLICEYGETALCSICADHPRFRSFFSSFTEIGLGLSCEEAARIVLTFSSPFSQIVLSDDGKEEFPDEEEAELLSLRDELIGIMEDNALPVRERIRRLFDTAQADMSKLSFENSADFLLSLERLDEQWGKTLLSLKYLPSSPLPAALELPLQNLSIYFIYRHMPDALIAGDFLAPILLCAFLSWLALSMLERRSFETGGASIEDAIDIARMISGELEYSDENTDLILENLFEKFA